MKNSLKILVAVLVGVLALLVTAAPDTFYLGTGRSGFLSQAAPAGVVNSYAQVVQGLDAGQRAIAVQTTSGFDAGDLIMVLQPVAGSLNVAPGSDASVSLSAQSSVGRWEFARLEAVDGGGDGGLLILTEPLVHSYGQGLTQAIRVPEYTTLRIAPDAGLRAEPWNGATGGVLVFLVRDTLINDGTISATGAGFRGGVYQDDDDNQNNCTALTGSPPDFAQRGEGIAKFDYGDGGRGNMANGGGGGVCRSSGGGGGGNLGAGGLGGASEPNNGTPRNVGGLGGSALNYNPRDFLTFGGGGGSGHGRANNANASGGRGGGIIYIRAGTLLGQGRIVASGEDGGSVTSGQQAGAGGGGAGGTIVVRVAGFAECQAIEANGGAGGNNANTDGGPGGGGGGGRVQFQSASGTCATVAFNAGPAGTSGGGGNYGALPGQNGNSQPLQGGGGVSEPPSPTIIQPLDNSYVTAQPLIVAIGLPDTDPRDPQVYFYLTDGTRLVRQQEQVETDGGVGYYSFDTRSANLQQEVWYSVQAATVLQGVESLKSPPTRFLIDSTVPDASIDAGPPALTNSRSAPFVLWASESPVEFRCQLTTDGGPADAGFLSCGQQPTFNNLLEGSHTLVVIAIDKARNTSPVSAPWNWTVDLTPPEAPLVLAPAANALLDGGSLVDGGLLIRGTVVGGSRVALQRNNASLGSVPVDGDGGWSYIWSPADEGLHWVQAASSDDAGNVGPPSAAVFFRLDRTLPSIPTVSSPEDGGYVNVSSPLILGQAEQRSTVLVLLASADAGGDAGAPLTTIANGSGLWSVLPATLADGTYTLYVSAQDEALNPSPDAGVYVFTVDTAHPNKPVIEYPTPNQTLTVAQPTFRGSAEQGTLVFVYVDDQLLGQVSVHADGGWQLGSPYPDGGAPLAQGRHWVRARARDQALNESSFSNTVVFNVDTIVTPPVITFPEDGGFLRADPLFVTGGAEPGSWLDVRFAGTSTNFWSEAAYADVDGGAWTFLVPMSLMEGPYTVQAIARDSAGNTADSGLVHFVVDRTPPQTLISGGPSEYTNQRDAGFLFTASGSSVSFECALGSGFSNDGGTCPANYSLSNLDEQTYTLLVRARDQAGNVDPTPASWTWTVDTTPPTVTIDAGPPPVTNSDVAVFRFSANEPVRSYECFYNDGGSPCQSPHLLERVPPGDHVFQVRATDLAGNISGLSAPRSWFVNPNLPVPVITSRPAPVNNLSQVQFTFDTRVQTDAGVELYYYYQPGRTPDGFEEPADGGIKAAPREQVTINVDQRLGTHLVVVKALEPERNVATPRELYATYTWRLDTEPPKTSFALVPQPLEKVKEARFQATGQDESGISDFRCSLNGAAWDKCAGDVTGPLLTLTVSGLQEGANTLRVRAVDVAGNEGATPAEYTWTVDTTPPKRPLFDATSGEIRVASLLPELSGGLEGQAEADVRVIVQLLEGSNWERIALAQTDRNGRWRTQVARPLTEGVHTLRAYAIDPATNDGPLSSEVTLVVDTELPSEVIGGGLNCNSAVGSPPLLALLALAGLLWRVTRRSQRKPSLSM